MSGRKLNAQRLCLYDLEWQILRVQLEGHWTSMSAVEKNLEVLDKYIWGVPWPNVSVMISRVYRVINYLNAVRMGYHGMCAGNSDMSKTVMDFRDALQDTYDHFVNNLNSLAAEGFNWNWEIPSKNKYKEEVLLIDRSWVEKVLKSLKKRFTFAIYTKKSTTKKIAEAEVRKSRPELVWAIESLEETLA